MRPVRPVATAVALVLAATAAASAQSRPLGTIDFPNSGAAAGQADFVEGVLLLHSFEFGDAAEAFRRAQAADPDFALAYWGEAMTYNHPLWREQDREAGRAVLARYDARGVAVPTEREAAYLDAVRTLYGEGTKAERDRAYMDAMARMQERWPDDPEARAFHALAILGSTDGVREFATYMRAAATAQPVFDANPDHPGAAHYLIHSFDDPVHAPLGLPAAVAYADIAPGAAHAQHMTSHIFVAMGMWDDVVAANIRARDVQDRANLAGGGRTNPCGHYTSWLHYGYLMQGRPEQARTGLEACMERMRDRPNRAEQSYFVGMRARHVLDLEDWEAAEAFVADLTNNPPARSGQAFVSAYAAARTGDRTRAETLLGQMADGDDDPRVRIQRLEIEALLALDAAEGDRAVALLEEAVALEETLPFEFGPPASLKPPHELLGEVLLELARPTEAVDAFRRALALTPRRTLSLMGLSHAASQAGMVVVAADAEGELAEVWASAEPAFADVVGR